MNLTAHIAHRQRLSSPVLSRAHEGNLAAQRLAGVKQAYESYRQEWQVFHRAFDEGGDNYRAAHEMELSLCDEIMAGLFRDYDIARHCELAAIEMERAA